MDASDLVKHLEPEIEHLRGVAEGFGLTFDPVTFCQSNRDNLSLIASFGLPNRFSHWYFGGLYKNLKFQQDHNLISILELVLNTDPVYAFLLDTNTHLENLMVVAHVFGHVDFFHNNTWYARSEKGMLNVCEMHARRIREIIGPEPDALDKKYRRAAEAYERDAKAWQERKDRVDEIIEVVLAIAGSVNAFEPDPRERQKRLIYWLLGELPRLVAGTRKSDGRVTRGIVKKADPRYEDLRLALAVVQMMTREMEYFDLIWRSQIINEGWASFVEFKVLEKVLEPQQWLEFSFQLSKRPAPYVIGFTLFHDIFQRGGWPKCLEVRRFFYDENFIDQYLTQGLVEELDLFVVDKESKEPNRDVRKVKEKILEEKQTRGAPQVIVGKYDRKNLHVTIENPEPERSLDRKRTELFLKKLRILWPFEISLIDGESVYRSKNGSVSVEKK